MQFDGGGVGGKGQGRNEMLSDVGGRGGSEFPGCRSPIFIFFIKENWICVMTRHHAESNNILLRDLSVDSGVRQ